MKKEVDIVEVIFKVKGKWYIRSEKKDPKTGKPTKVEGPFATKELAQKRLDQWEKFKHMKK